MSSNYPNGFTNGVTIKSVPYNQTWSGNVYWVHSGGSNNNPGTFQKPWSTLDYAVGRCTANNNDIIYIKPGHTETVSSATALALDVAGITIIGLGNGDERPTYTLDTATTATIGVSAANISIYNVIFSANFADIVSFFTTTTAKNFKLSGCRFKATDTDKNSLYVVDTSTTDNDADGLTIEDCTWIEPDAATVGLIKQDASLDRVTIKGNYCNLGVNNNKSLVTIATGKIVTNLDYGWNKLYRLNTDSATGGLLLSTDGSTNTGCVYNNYVQHADTAAEILVTASSGLGFFENRASGVAGATGYVLPTVDS